MATRNEKTEMRWVDAWNDVYDIARGRREMPCMLPDWSIITVDECLGWLQQSVYEGYLVRVEEGWVGHRRGVIAHRWLPDSEPGTATN
jgi:hypothetical protein